MSTSVGSIPVEQMVTVASLALLVYDYLLTVGSEIERFWKRRIYRRFRWGSFLFFANRYLALLGYLPIILELLNQVDPEPTVNVYNRILAIALQTIIDCMILMRIRALYERRMRILAFPIIIAVCGITTGIVGMVKTPEKDMPTIEFRCDFGINSEQAYYLAGAFGGEFVFDVAIFAMTLHKTLTLPRGSGFGLLTMIMRDGTVYFGAMTTFNLADILFLVLADPVNRVAMINPLNIVSSIMMSRLMLNLRDPKLNGGSEEWKLTTLRFNRQTSSGATSNATVSMNTHYDEVTV